jgi:hypothetical protein
MAEFSIANSSFIQKILSREALAKLLENPSTVRQAHSSG